MLKRVIIYTRGEIMRYGEIKRMLKKNGCYKVSEGKEHERWFSPITGKKFSVSRHNGEEAKTGTYQSILRDAGLK